MPCMSSDGMGANTDYDARRGIDELRAKNDELTRMLCSLLRSLDDSVPLPADVAEWFHRHREWDRSQGRP